MARNVSATATCVCDSVRECVMSVQHDWMQEKKSTWSWQVIIVFFESDDLLQVEIVMNNVDVQRQFFRYIGSVSSLVTVFTMLVFIQYTHRFWWWYYQLTFVNKYVDNHLIITKWLTLLNGCVLRVGALSKARVRQDINKKDAAA